ncbi:MAG: WD40 repeat domain-containing protein [Symploca sp. SIO3C6]|nr:WD40 repeat domain-containing protein [Symploca sp. SIO3C6]
MFLGQLKVSSPILWFGVSFITGLIISSCSNLPTPLSNQQKSNSDPLNNQQEETEQDNKITEEKAKEGKSLTNSQPSPSPISQTLLSQNFPSVSDLPNSQIAPALEGHASRVELISFSRDGNLLASAEYQGIFIWDTKTREVRRILPGHRFSEYDTEPMLATSLAFSLDGSLLASSSWSQGGSPKKSLIIWNPNTGEEIRSLAGSVGCRDVIFSPDGGKLISSCGEGIQVWNPKTGEQLLNFYSELPVEAIALHPQGKILATVDLNLTGGEAGEESNAIKLWNLNAGGAQPLRTLKGHNRDINKIAFTPDGQFLVSGSFISGEEAEGTIKIWDWQQGKSIRTQGYDGESFSLSQDSKLIAGNFGDGILLELKTGQKIDSNINIPMQGGASALAFSPDGKILAWAGQPPTFPNPLIRLWPVGEPIAEELSLASAASNRANYMPIPLIDIWAEGLPIIAEPKAIAVSPLRIPALKPAEEEEVSVEYPHASKAIVTITQTNLPDDSVLGLRYRIEFAPYGSQQQGKFWKVVWVGTQQKCQPGRGNQNWSSANCN